MLDKQNLFYFGPDDSDCYVIFKENGEVKYFRFDKKFLKKVDETIWLKRELRKIKTYMSVKNTIPLDKVLELLYGEYKYRWNSNGVFSDADERCNEMIRKFANCIRNLKE